MTREGIIVVPKDGVFYAFGGDNGMAHCAQIAVLFMCPCYAGFNGPYFNDVWMSADHGRTWTELVEHAEWSERTGQVGVLMGEYIVMIAGYPDLTDMWRSKDGKSWELVTMNCWNCSATARECGKFDFEFFVDDSNGEQRVYTIAGDQEVTAPIPQDNDVWYYHNSSIAP